MQFSDADLREFIAIWEHEFHQSISMDEARQSASLLMELYTLLLEFPPESSLRVSESSSSDHRT